MKDSRRRSIAKGVSWRVIASGTTMTFVYIFTGSVETMAGVGILDMLAKLTFYYGHERAWTMVTWGKVPLKR